MVYKPSTAKKLNAEVLLTPNVRGLAPENYKNRSPSLESEIPHMVPTHTKN
jgi:hypothetical protein